ncbi:MAG: hypothetical protein ACR2MR_06390 [Dietzia maris]
MLDLVYHILTNDTPTNTASGGRIHPMMRPQTETLPAIIFGLTDSKFENVSTMGGTTGGTTRAASDIYTIGIACLDGSISDSFALHTKTRAALEAFTTGDVNLSANSYRVHSIHLVDVLSSVDEEGEIYVFEGVFEVKVTIL